MAVATGVLVVGVYAAVMTDWVPGGAPRRAFRKVSPSVVFVDGPYGYGSGVVLNEDGLILTNRHVAEIAGPVTIRASVRLDGCETVVEFPQVTLVGVHPEYDAALLKVSAGKARFHPASIRWTNTVETGEICYAVGNPGTYGVKALRNTITPGIVSAARRRMLGLDYIQTSAPINGGNSGGALCDTSGNVIGIVTFKLPYADMLGFAIPCWALKTNSFVAPETDRDIGLSCLNDGTAELDASRAGSPVH